MHSSSLSVLMLAARAGASSQFDGLTLPGPGAQIGATFRDPAADSVVTLVREGRPRVLKVTPVPGR